MMEIKAKNSDPLELRLYYNKNYVWHYNITDIQKGGPTHSFILAFKPKNETGGSPNADVQEDVKLCSERFSPKPADIFRLDCVAAAIGM